MLQVSALGPMGVVWGWAGFHALMDRSGGQWVASAGGVWAGGRGLVCARCLRTPLFPQGLPGDLSTPPPCLVCCSSLPPAWPCKRCGSFCAAVLQGASFVPLGGPGRSRTP